MYKINHGYITQKIDNKTTIFSGEDSMLHTLNETGAYIFQGLKLGWDDTKIISGLVEKFGANLKEAKSDLKEFTGILLEKKIISQT